jgi:hypothetical protein
MVGNLDEWVADWVPLSTDCSSWGGLSDDLMCLTGASTAAGGPGALLRGGDFRSRSSAGPLAVVGSGEELEAWSSTLERLPFITRSEIGRSIENRPLYKLEIGTLPASAPHVVIIGRQHPPEVTGSLALMRFVEEIVGDSNLARAFRKRYRVLLVPLLNPDGVEHGHWRSNMGGVDLNRDWGIFAQPETRAVRDQILALKEHSPIVLHLDFHSTYNDVFYTQPDEPMVGPDTFTRPWIEGIQRRFPDYKVNRSPSEPVRLTTSQS